MLSGSGLEIAIAMLLGGAVLLGFLLHWLWLALGGRKAAAAQINDMADRLHDADLAREAADAARIEAEAALALAEANAAEQIALMQARMEGAVEGREAELARALDEARRDAEALQDGLGHARQRIFDLESELEERRGGES
jgi:F0F1-type ATP synthase membrane subunit b/b'